MRPLSKYFFVALTTLSWVGCTGTHEQHKDKVAVARNTPRPAGQVFDVPGLLGLSFPQLCQRLGAPGSLPPGFVDPITLPLVQRGVSSDSAAFFKAGPLRIIATYEPRSLRVSDLILLGDSEEELMYQGKLEQSAEQYIILPVYELRRPRELMGLRVISKKM